MIFYGFTSNNIQFSNIYLSLCDMSAAWLSRHHVITTFFDNVSVVFINLVIIIFVVKIVIFAFVVILNGGTQSKVSLLNILWNMEFLFEKATQKRKPRTFICLCGDRTLTFTIKVVKLCLYTLHSSVIINFLWFRNALAFKNDS